MISATIACITAFRSGGHRHVAPARCPPRAPRPRQGPGARLTLRYLLGQFGAPGLERCQLRRQLLDPAGTDLLVEPVRVQNADASHGALRSYSWMSPPRTFRGARPSFRFPWHAVRGRSAQGRGRDEVMWSRHSRRTEPTHRSGNAFALSERTGVFTTVSPSVRNNSSHGLENLASRSRSRMCLPSRHPVIARL
jgi:hypothetical protein